MRYAPVSSGQINIAAVRSAAPLTFGPRMKLVHEHLRDRLPIIASRMQSTPFGPSSYKSFTHQACFVAAHSRELGSHSMLAMSEFV
ncbi:MAG: hypothetical protein WA840_13650 [Caulobacteraceae bacterium]